MKKEVAPSIIIAVIVVVLAVIAYFYYSKTATPPPKEASVFGADGPTSGARDGAGGPGMTPDVMPPAAPQAPR